MSIIPVIFGSTTEIQKGNHRRGLGLPP